MMSYMVRMFRKWRNGLLGFLYARRLDAAGIRCTGRCDVRIEGFCRVGSGLFMRSRNHHRVQISVLPEGRLKLGDGVFINQGARITVAQEVMIGNNVLIGDDVIILDGDFHGIGSQSPKSAPIRIEDDVWIASRAIILKGVVIGKGAVVGAGAIVTGDVPPHAMVCGPAATVKQSIDPAGQNS